MLARVAAVVLSGVMTGTPAATTACQAACAEREHAAGATGEQHSCAHQTSADEPAVTGGAHPCGHSDDSSNAIDRTLQTVHAPGAVPVLLCVTPPTAVASRVLADNVADHLAAALTLRT
ncbi:MAG TPA: hypothetical protein VKC35_12400, partial [Vicinamibacterales bacterium]|nr:hypothetical protein [Vicinamibacterales bacterium]